MGCSLLWVASICVGNSHKMQVKNGWQEISTVWMALVGKAGTGKTPSIKQIIRPLMKSNNKEIKNFQKNHEKYLAYDSLSKEEKQQTEEVRKPVKSQFIANDITIEALVDLHQHNKNGVGVFRDELGGFIKDMNKYRAGSDLETWLGSWSGEPINMNRKTAGNAFVDQPSMSVLGGIQPAILDTFYTDENKDNGFVDRILLCYPDVDLNPKYNDNEMDQKALDWYQDGIIFFYDRVKALIQTDEEGEIEPQICRFSEEANTEWVRIFEKIRSYQMSDDQTEYMKSMYPKQMSYVPRFAMLIHLLNKFTGQDVVNPLFISKESVLKAERLSDYFIAMAKKIKLDSSDTRFIKTFITENSKLTDKEVVLKLKEVMPKVATAQLAEILGKDIRSIQRYLK